MIDLLEEIFNSIRKNKLRTFLTGFSIAWGIFMLIILLASGNGLRNGMQENFRYMSSNSVSLYPGRTTMPYKGMPKGREIKLKEDDIDYLKKSFPTIVGDITPMTTTWNSTISYKQEYTNPRVEGVNAEYQRLRNIDVIAGKGRFINEADLREDRKVALLHENTVKILFRNGENPLGQYVRINKIPFQVVGIYTDMSGGGQNPSVLIPYTTGIAIFTPSGDLRSIPFEMKTLQTKEETEAFIEEVRKRLGAKHQFDPADRNAIWIWDRLTDFLQAQGIFNGIALFVWIIAIGTLIAGVVGISNIMLITVKERTREFGIRKALGATPSSILRMILLESVIITAVFGYIGMVVGIGLTEMINMGMEQMAQQSAASGAESHTIFKNPTVDLGVVLMATLLLIVAGLIAGYVPAKKAVSIKPIEALRGE